LFHKLNLNPSRRNSHRREIFCCCENQAVVFKNLHSDETLSQYTTVNFIYSNIPTQFLVQNESTTRLSRFFFPFVYSFPSILPQYVVKNVQSYQKRILSALSPILTYLPLPLLDYLNFFGFNLFTFLNSPPHFAPSLSLSPSPNSSEHIPLDQVFNGSHKLPW
jgi:hypothetical protein